MKSTKQNYGTVSVAIHLLSALLIPILIGSVFRSGFSLDPATKAAALRLHLPVAIFVLLLTRAAGLVVAFR